MKTPKQTFRAPAEHSLLLAAFLLIWLGPVLKLAGVLSCSWQLAFLAFEILWLLGGVAYLAEAVVGIDPSWTQVQPDDAD